MRRDPAVAARGVSLMAHVRLRHRLLFRDLLGNLLRGSKGVVGFPLSPGCPPCHKYTSALQHSPGLALSWDHNKPRKAGPSCFGALSWNARPAQGRCHQALFPVCMGLRKDYLSFLFVQLCEDGDPILSLGPGYREGTGCYGPKCVPLTP